MLKYSLLSFLLIGSMWSQTTIPVTPQPPACLSAPVVQGSVTLSCSLIDNTAANGAAPMEFGASDAYLFQVRLSSTDPEVIGFRVGLSYTQPGITAADGVSPLVLTAWGTVGKGRTGYAQTVPVAPTPGYRYTFLLGSPSITSIQIQELKPSSSQTF